MVKGKRADCVYTYLLSEHSGCHSDEREGDVTISADSMDAITVRGRCSAYTYLITGSMGAIYGRCSRYLFTFSADSMGAMVVRGKWIRG